MVTPTTRKRTVEPDFSLSLCGVMSRPTLGCEPSWRCSSLDQVKIASGEAWQAGQQNCRNACLIPGNGLVVDLALGHTSRFANPLRGSSSEETLNSCGIRQFWGTCSALKNSTGLLFPSTRKSSRVRLVWLLPPAPLSFFFEMTP